MSGRITVSAAEIARLARVERAAVSNWRRRHRDFPSPSAGTPSRPLYALTAVEEWLKAKGKVRFIPTVDLLWQELRAEDRRLVETLADVAVLLCLVDMRIWDELAALPDDRLCEELPDALAAYTATHRIPGGVPFADGLSVERIPVWRSVARLAEEFGSERLFDDLHDRFVGAHGRTAGTTSLELAILVASMVPPVIDGPILDPACGTGTLLGVVGNKRGLGSAEAGQELDPAFARIAWFRVVWCGVGGETVRQGDSLRDDRFAETTAQVVVCDPPTGHRDWGFAELAYDSRWEFGLPSRTEPELAWLQHCYAHLRPGGTAIVVMPVAVASRRSGRRIRAEILRRGALREIVALPPGLGAHGLGLHLWILGRPDSGGQTRVPGGVRMVDGSRFDRARLRELDEDWWHRLRNEPGVTAEIPVVDLLDDDVDLTPSRHVHRGGPDLAGAYEAAERGLVPTLTRLARRTPPTLNRAAAPADWPMVSIAELIRAEAVVLIPGRELARGQVVLRRGDILVPALHSEELPVVVGEPRRHRLGRMPYDRHLLRCDPGLFDPHFVAGFLRSEVNTRQAVKGSGAGLRFDPRRALIPRLPLAEQRRYGAEFLRLAEFADRLTQAARAGADLVRLAHDALTSGTVTPSP
ncbi:N-6 DNA methylase [Rhizohabitans arisaemae]|uniref:N-6 DNA methylase n=1 Tax=Rhizohabitans arisaemae TaxID=2720610 RepID=UPI0024B08583|nr:N-6 DNA methylase [Rhizohabitans arisaemae]